MNKVRREYLKILKLIAKSSCMLGFSMVRVVVDHLTSKKFTKIAPPIPTHSLHLVQKFKRGVPPFKLVLSGFTPIDTKTYIKNLKLLREKLDQLEANVEYKARVVKERK